ncbi:MAG TPA: hypothetical protein PKC91_00545 [Ignavibacteria bacterium]|nr:hypothetical protein [Ignavibacteria bacterium]
MLEYFKSLSEKELEKFEDFVFSPYFNKQRNNVKLFQYLKSLYPHIRNIDISKENLSVNVYGESKVNDVKIRKLISEFSILMERFFSQIEMEEDSIRNKILLLGALRKRGFQKRFEMNHRTISNILKKVYSKDESFYLNKINLVNEIFYFKFGDIRGELEIGLQEKSDNLDYFYAFTKLHCFNEMIHNEGVINKNKFFNKKNFNEIISLVENNKDEIYKNHPNLLIIYYVVNMFQTLDDKYLYGLIDFLKNKEKKFRKKNLKYYYHYLTQYFVKKTNMGHVEFRQKAFEMYKYMKERRLFVIDNIITDFEYNNVVNICLSLKEYDWVDSYIEEYKKYLDPNFASDAYNLAKAKLLFHRKEFDNIFTYLNKVEIRDANYYVHSKFLLGKVYFDMNNVNGVKYIIDNLRQYLRIKKSISEEQSDIIKKFIYYISELIKIKESIPSSKKSLKLILKKELDNEVKLVTNKDWFYEKINKF